MRSTASAPWVFGLALLLPACGGGGGGTSLPEAAFVTADPRGMTTGGAVGDAAGGPAPAGAEEVGAGQDLAREIAEADVYRVEGDTLYLANTHRGLAVVDLGGACVVGTVALGGFPHEMFVRSGRAIVLVTRPDGTGEVVDVSLADPTAPAVSARLPLGGWYRESRLVGDVLYVVTGDGMRSFALDPSLAAADSLALPHEAAFVHATDATFVVAGWGHEGTTPLTLVDVSDPSGGLALRGRVDVAGWMSDDHKLDLRGDVLRAVTHDWTDGGLSRLFTIDASDPDAPAVMAVLELARGEQLFATRFDGESAYVVTFERVDPLWVVDLHDPWAPSVAGFLTVPGWSTHLVPTGDGRLVAVGIEADAGWNVVASLFDVGDPTAPALLDRADLGPGTSLAFEDVKALGVFPADGLVLLPVAGPTDRLAVLDLSASALDLRGGIAMEGTVLRGFPHARGLVGVSTEEVVVADPATLADVERCTIAENVVDVDRLPDGRLLPLVARRSGGRLGDVALPLVPERLYRHGAHVAVLGWDDLGRAARVVDFTADPPVVSARFDLGGAWYALGDPGWGMVRPEGSGYGGASGSGDAVLADDGRLVVHGLPWGSFGGGGVPMPIGTGLDGEGVAPPPDEGTGVIDGFVVIDVVAATLEAPIEVEDGYVTGFVADDGGDLVYTVGGPATEDAMGRPRMRHDLVRLDLATRAATGAVNVPGRVVSAEGDLVFTAEDAWTDGWDWECAVLAVSVDAGAATILDRRVLPEGAWDLRAAGGTLCFLASAAYGEDPWIGLPAPSDEIAVGTGPGMPWSPTTTVHVLRLGPTIEDGPPVPDDGSFRTLLLVEDGSLLAVRDGLTVESWDVTGAVASKDWEAEVAGYPGPARADPDGEGYLVALGYAGWAPLP